MSDLFAVDPDVYRVQDRHLFWAFEEDDEDGGVLFGRPPVNPWRHAYVRSRHFRRAANRIRFRNMMLGCPVGHQIAEANRAAENAAWGCDPEQHVKRPDS